MKTMGQARREAGIPESDYIRTGDSLRRISTIRQLARWFGPPDARYEHIDSCALRWSQYAPDGERLVHVGPEGHIYS